MIVTMLVFLSIMCISVMGLFAGDFTCKLRDDSVACDDLSA